MSSIEFFLPIIVAPKQTKMNRLCKRKDGSAYMGRFTPKAVKENEAEMQKWMEPHIPASPLTGPLSGRIVFQYPWLKKHSLELRSRGSLAKTTRPDVDNLMKNLADTMERVGFFANDAQIHDVRLSKVFTDAGGVQVFLGEDDE